MATIRIEEQSRQSWDRNQIYDFAVCTGITCDIFGGAGSGDVHPPAKKVINARGKYVFFLIFIAMEQPHRFRSSTPCPRASRRAR